MRRGYIHTKNKSFVPDPPPRPTPSSQFGPGVNDGANCTLYAGDPGFLPRLRTPSLLEVFIPLLEPENTISIGSTLSI